jgi:hypothetical protein
MRWKKGGGGAPLFSRRQDPCIFFRSLFGFGTVEFGIAGPVFLPTDSGSSLFVI